MNSNIKEELEKSFPDINFASFTSNETEKSADITIDIKIKECTLTDLNKIKQKCHENYDYRFNFTVTQMIQEPFLIGDRVLEVGVDEVGRGTLISRVYAAAVFWDPKITPDIVKKAGIVIKDSKKMNLKQRLDAVEFIKENCLAYGIGYATEQEIDEINILQASILAMHRAIKNTNIVPEHILVDGTQFNLYENNNGDFIDHTTIIGGDNYYYSIAAASILAKVERDNFIENLCDEDPQLDIYDLRSNKGYGSAKHIQAIEHWGISQYHRKTFGICKKYTN